MDSIGRPRALTIAGSDSGGGAGIQADLKTFAAWGVYGTSAITALTAQNTVAVTAVHLVPPAIVTAQIEAVVSDIGCDAVKIGMIGSAEIAHAVADRLEALDCPIVFDPVMIATSGSVLADPETIAAFERLMTIASVVTPNLPELTALGGRQAVLAYGCHLAEKGGHKEGPMMLDQLYAPKDRLVMEIEAERIDTPDTHGTGCTFAAALATGLGSGLSIGDAFIQAVRFVRLAILNAPGLGEGHGPVGHALGMVPFDVVDEADDA